jgi:hypothetical protein
MDLVFTRLGNWRLACRKFGIPFHDLATYSYASKEHVIEGLRRLPWEPPPSLNSVYRTDRSLGTAVYRFFKSWPDVMIAGHARLRPQDEEMEALCCSVQPDVGNLVLPSAAGVAMKKPTAR